MKWRAWWPVPGQGFFWNLTKKNKNKSYPGVAKISPWVLPSWLSRGSTELVSMSGLLKRVHPSHPRSGLKTTPSCWRRPPPLLSWTGYYLDVIAGPLWLLLIPLTYSRAAQCAIKLGHPRFVENIEMRLIRNDQVPMDLLIIACLDSWKTSAWSQTVFRSAVYKAQGKQGQRGSFEPDLIVLEEMPRL